ncbi:hypothetical protein [Chitinophaga varians]|nr:hypothetical protein [Chitinophaga varians]
MATIIIIVITTVTSITTITRIGVTAAKQPAKPFEQIVKEHNKWF